MIFFHSPKESAPSHQAISIHKMTYIIKGKNNDYELVVGCEIHAQIASNSKLFSRAATEFGALQNSQVSLVDAAMPGMLPTINEECVKQAVKMGLGINAQSLIVKIIFILTCHKATKFRNFLIRLLAKVRLKLHWKMARKKSSTWKEFTSNKMPENLCTINIRQ